MTVRRSDLLKIMLQMSKENNKLEQRLLALEVQVLPVLQERLLKLESSHHSLLRRYNELEVRWPTLIKITK